MAKKNFYYIILKHERDEVMYNYAYGKDAKNLFIRSYKVEEDVIVVKYSNGKIDKIPFNEANVAILQERMRKQVTDFKPGLSRLAMIGGIIGTVILAPISYDLYMEAALLPDFITTAISTACTFGCAFLAANKACVLSDHSKHKFFLANEEKLNEGIAADNTVLKFENNTTGMSKNGHKKVLRAKVETGLDINSIDQMSLKDLKELRENLNRARSFSYDYTGDTPSVIDGPTLTKKNNQ